MTEKIKLKLLEDLHEKIKKKSESLGFNDINNYIVSVLEKDVKEDHCDKYTPEEEEQIKKRLKDLGYIE